MLVNMPVPDSHMDDLTERIPCRQEQLRTLCTLFGKPHQMTVPSLFIYGHTATGKTLCIRSIMEAHKLPHVFINCVECYVSKLLYQRVLNELSGHVPSPENDYTNYARCDNMNDFVRLLKSLIKNDPRLLSQTVYLVCSRAERLRDMEANLLPALLRLQELTDSNVCVILESEIVWNKFCTGTGFMEPLAIHFPEYSKEELLEVMSSSHMGSEYPVDMMSSYHNLVISIFHAACRNLRELLHMAQLNFPKYIEPIKRGEANPGDVRKLWRHIEPHLKEALQTVYLREVSSSQWEKMQAESEDERKSALSAATGLMSSSRVYMELPYYSKFLLIAAYLASYNPAKSDRRFFAKPRVPNLCVLQRALCAAAIEPFEVLQLGDLAELNAGRINKRTVLNVDKKSERTSSQLLGPKAFPLDRLMAIFYSIVEEKVAPSAYIYSQISSLVSLGLLAQLSGSDSLESPKYKCLVSLDLIRSVSKNVGFEVVRYLYDYVG